MKRFIILLLLLITISFTAKAERTYYKTSSFTVRTNNVWSNWMPSNLLISIDNTDNRIVIYSKEKQIIDFEKFDSVVTSEYILLDSQATDSKYKKIYIKIQIYDVNTIFLSVIYKDIQYIYQMSMTQ